MALRRLEKAVKGRGSLVAKWDVFRCDLSPSQAREVEASVGASGRSRVVFHSLNLIGDSPNLTWELKAEHGDDTGGDALDDLTEDLLAVASHIYQADRVVRRSSRPMGWSRLIELHIGVRLVKAWKDEKTEIEAVLRNVTQDTFRLFFYERVENRPSLRLPAIDSPVIGGICIFSTRFTSAFGFVTQLAQGSLIASVRYGPDSPKSAQDRLVKEISALTEGFHLIGFRLTPSNLDSVERTQRTLGFLQLALAASLARRQGVRKIQLFDDAVSSYHLQPRQLCGPGFAVRDTRPDFLSQTYEIFKRLTVADRELEILHPFQFSTAVQMLQMPKTLTKKQRQSLLAKTDSCLEKDLAIKLRPRWKDSAPHCGCCFPCKMRRLAALAAGLETPQDYSAYAINPLRRYDVRKLGKNLAKRVEEYHNKGLSALKNYLQGFKGRSVSNPINPMTKITIASLASPKLLFGPTPGAPGTTNPEVVIAKWIIDIHEQFGKEVLRFIP
jgi:hypothetical protein